MKIIVKPKISYQCQELEIGTHSDYSDVESIVGMLSSIAIQEGGSRDLYIYCNGKIDHSSVVAQLGYFVPVTYLNQLN